MLLVRLPLAHVGITILPDERALALLVTLMKLSRVFITVGILEDAGTRTGTVLIVALIDITVLELIDTATVHLVVRPLTHIGVTVGIFIGAST